MKRFFLFFISLFLLFSSDLLAEKKDDANRLFVSGFEQWPNQLGGQMWVNGGAEPNWNQPVHSWIYGPDTKDYKKEYVHLGKYSFRLVNSRNPKNLPWASFTLDLGPITDITVEPKKVESLDVSGYGYLTFWIRGHRGGEKYQVSFRDASQREVTLIPYPKEASKKWKQVKIPLSSIAKEIDLTQLDAVSLSFGSSVKNPIGSVLYVDDWAFVGIKTKPKKEIVFKQVEQEGLWIADFEQELSLLEGEMSPYGGAKANFNNREQLHSSLYSPDIENYSIKDVFRGTGSYRLVNEIPFPTKNFWASLSIDLISIDQMQEKPLKRSGIDVSKYRYLIFWAKGEHGGERIKVIFRDAKAPDFLPQVMIDPYPQILTKEWRKIVVPLSQVSNEVDLSDLIQIGIEFGSWLGNLRGDVLFVDDFIFSNLLNEP